MLRSPCLSSADPSLALCDFLLPVHVLGAMFQNIDFLNAQKSKQKQASVLSMKHMFERTCARTKKTAHTFQTIAIARISNRHTHPPAFLK